MNMRMLHASDREQAEEMWRVVFQDSPAFSAYYFTERFHPEYSFGAFDDDRLIAMALGRPTEIAVENRIVPAMLVAGVSTLPDYRKQGHMHRLMTLLIDRAKASGFACCYLHPVTESLYASLGFQNGTEVTVIRSDTARAGKRFDLKESAAWEDMLSVYQTISETHDGMQLRDRSEFQCVFRDYAADDAKTMIAYAQKRPVGYICYSDTGEVFELLALCAPAYTFLLDEAAKRTGRELKTIVPTDCGVAGERRYSMQYLVFDNALRLPLKNGFCCLAY